MPALDRSRAKQPIAARAGDRSGCTAAVIPAVAMVASTIFEGYRWSAAALLGMMRVVAGTVLGASPEGGHPPFGAYPTPRPGVFQRRRARKRRRPPEEPREKTA